MLKSSVYFSFPLNPDNRLGSKRGRLLQMETVPVAFNVRLRSRLARGKEHIQQVLQTVRPDCSPMFA